MIVIWNIKDKNYLFRNKLILGMFRHSILILNKIDRNDINNQYYFNYQNIIKVNMKYT